MPERAILCVQTTIYALQMLTQKTPASTAPDLYLTLLATRLQPFRIPDLIEKTRQNDATKPNDMRRMRLISTSFFPNTLRRVFGGRWLLMFDWQPHAASRARPPRGIRRRVLTPQGAPRNLRGTLHFALRTGLRTALAAGDSAEEACRWKLSFLAPPM